jgi:predicted O-methyltransferase YrrM
VPPSPDQDRWTAVDRYLADRLLAPDVALDAALEASAAAGLPAHGVSPTPGRLIELLARIQGARTILEIGTLGGYSTIWLGRGLALKSLRNEAAVLPRGRIATLRQDSAIARLARRAPGGLTFPR